MVRFVGCGLFRGDGVRLRGCVFSMLFVCLGAPAAIGETPSGRLDWVKTLKRCHETAALLPSDTSKRIAQKAIDEFYLFGGHRINSLGLLFSFGSVESENEEDANAIPETPNEMGRPRKAYRLRHLAWWNVLRYWRELGAYARPSEAASAYLELQGYKGATAIPKDEGTSQLPSLEVGKALAAIDKIDGAHLSSTEKEVVKEAIIRAGLNDMAWSAAFVSTIVRHADLKSSQFPYSRAHRTYIYAAFKASADEAANKNSPSYYRACPAGEVLPRIGDLVCYHRETKEHGTKTPDAIRNIIAREIDAASDGGRSIKNTHCDVVAHYDEGAKKIYVVGGNVQQSVTVKKLSLKDDYTFNELQPEVCDVDKGHWTLPKPREGQPLAPHFTKDGNPGCSLNKKHWFIVLQARDDVTRRLVVGRAN